jgi:hypothetical protein
MTVVVTAAATVLVFLCGLPGPTRIFSVLFAMLAFPIGAVTLIASSTTLAVRKRPRKAASYAIALLAPVLLWMPITWTAEILHLGLTAYLGGGQLGSAAKLDGDQFAVADWSVGLAGGPNTFLIHDVSDEISLPTSRHRRPIALENGFADSCDGKVSHLIGHYYLCTF